MSHSRLVAASTPQNLITGALVQHSLHYPAKKPEDKRASSFGRAFQTSSRVQGTQVRHLVREDTTCRRAAKPVATATQACVPGAGASNEKPLQ
ncbi:hypothetical protein JEQ12_010154 [Ovis aries]|uniref:Uncharacterized protein n=1 Tax=Ovis aries TaxID=9940 RepID=A0A836ANP3_SHEEP|nr:hypothetical protein JEQ12_010154 [Ovis aries]